MALYFIDVTRVRVLTDELGVARRQAETAYEELQSIVEELETTNEELQSTVEELDTTKELWGLRSDEVAGKHVLNLDIRISLDQVRPMIRRVLGVPATEEITVDAVNRRGRAITVRVACSHFAVDDGHSAGAILIMDMLPDGQPAGVAAPV